MPEKIQKTDAEWRSELTPAQYQVLREKGTERAFSGEYDHAKQPGQYVCAGCGKALFRSDEKFDSGSGWPSFWAPVEDDAVETEQDRSYGMVRTEVKCSDLRRPPGPRVRRRPATHRLAVLHQLGGAEARSEVDARGAGAIRALLENERSGVLATLSARRDGWPFASVAPYALTEAGEPLLLLSRLAEHTRNLQADARASLLVQDHASLTDPQAGARITILGQIEALVQA